MNPGWCTVCRRPTVFLRTGPWPRDDYVCRRCRSKPRHRALIWVLDHEVAGWASGSAHESSPSGPASEVIAGRARSYAATQYLPDVAAGALVGGVPSQDLQALTFDDATFDLHVTQDVFEHVFDPAAAFSQIARTLRPGGAHVFTVPLYPAPSTRTRAIRGETGEVRHLEPAEYHWSPVDAAGSLVVTEWGADLPAFVERVSGLPTRRYALASRWLGIDDPMLGVYVSRKPA